MLLYLRRHWTHRLQQTMASMVGTIAPTPLTTEWLAAHGCDVEDGEDVDPESPTPGFGLKVKPASAKVAPAVEGTADAKAAGDDDKAGGSALDQPRSKGKERQVSIRIAPGEGGDATTS